MSVDKAQHLDDYDTAAGFRRLRVAAANFQPWPWHKDWNADRMTDAYVDAAAHDVDLVVLPECCLDGYCTMPALAFADLRDKLVDIAEPIDGPYVQRFRKLAKQHKTCLVFGMAERSGRRDVYNTAVFIDHRGNVCGSYRKMQFAEGCHPSHHFNRIGKKLRAFDTPIGRCGIMICNDRWNPMIARGLRLDGAQFICIPTFGSRGKKQDDIVLARARENGVPIVQTNVGLNLIVSRGEIVAREKAKCRITLAAIDVPQDEVRGNARKLERNYLKQAGPRMTRRWRDQKKQLPAMRRNDPHRGRPPRPNHRPMTISDFT